MKYVKTPDDLRREQADLKSNPIMRFMLQKEYLTFNIGDILIKQTKQYKPHGEPEHWITETTRPTNAPRKYMYVFENELGIGYIKALRVDGNGFTSTLICVANYDPLNTKFILDPEYLDHVILSGGENFQYNEEYKNKKKFREEAIANNRKLLVKTHTPKILATWFDRLKIGDVFWMGNTFDELAEYRYEILKITENPMAHIPLHVEDNLQQKFLTLLKSHKTLSVKVDMKGLDNPRQQILTIDHFINRKVTMSEPYPVKDTLCGPRK